MFSKAVTDSEIVAQTAFTAASDEGGVTGGRAPADIMVLDVRLVTVQIILLVTTSMTVHNVHANVGPVENKHRS